MIEKFVIFIANTLNNDFFIVSEKILEDLFKIASIFAVLFFIAIKIGEHQKVGYDKK